MSAGKELEGGGLEIVMPEMGESVNEGTVLEWHVSEGDQIGEGETVVEVSTDKVDAEVPAPASGTITKILVGPDETVEVGKPLAEMTKGDAPSGDGASAGAEPEAPEPKAEAEAEDVPAADEGDGAKRHPGRPARGRGERRRSEGAQGHRHRRQDHQVRRALGRGQRRHRRPPRSRERQSRCEAPRPRSPAR